MKSNTSIIQPYFKAISQANTEAAKKELFQTLLTRLFDHDAEASTIIERMNLGAEKTIFNIPLKNRLKTGRADTQYNNVIIEWEKNIAKTGEHAKEQLTEYCLGNWHSGQLYHFTLIATDGLQWRIYAPTFIVMAEKTTVDKIELVQTDTFTLNENHFAEFPFFIDRYLFKTQPQQPTLANIQRDFGETSAVFINAMTVMQNHLPTLENQSELQTAYEQWQKFLHIAYGQFDGSREEMFFVHTYLSLFAKILAYTVISANQAYLPEKQLRGILTGEIFNQLNVERFVENDFYYWVALDEHFNALKPIFRDITRQLSEYDFSNVQEDILKGVYQELIDLETRHALGEYYTPDWLCERIMASLPVTKESKILDPACGSGSFLRAAVAKLKMDFPKLSATQLTSQIIGIDIHPLSVQIAKTTLLLALSDKIRHAKKPVTLQVYLANSLLLPEGTAGLFGASFKMIIDDKAYSLNMDIFDNPAEFDQAITLCNEIADYSSDTINHAQFAQHLQHQFNNPNIHKNINGLYRIYQAIKTAKDNGRDSIWQFILQNTYKPVFLKQQFDFIIGNPPWLTYSDVTNASYQQELQELAQTYALIPANKANMPHLEIAAIFFAHSANYFLKAGGSIAFVLPRSFLTADQHDNTRSGQAKGFQLTEIWDLDQVVPLFRVPATVIFAQQSPHPKTRPKTGIKGFTVKGKLESPHLRWESVKHALELTEQNWFYSILAQKARKVRSALTTTESKSHTLESYYAPLFKQGATIVPRSFYFVETEQALPDNWQNRIMQFKTSPSILREAKQPWKAFTLSGRINTHFLFQTALAKNIVPFVLINPPLVLLPIIVKKDAGKVIELKSADELFEQGEIETAKWFKEAQKLWDDNKTEKNQQNEVSLYEYLDWQKKLTRQNLNSRYLVFYTASAQDANAVVADRKKLELELIIESTTYWFATDNLNEAHYFTCFLNCGYTNQLIKAFQSRGLFGARHVHKKILELPFPKFDSNNPSHQQLAKWGKQCAIKAKNVVSDDKNLDLTTHKLGRLRKTVRQALSAELKDIDALVEDISQSVY
ncbi:MAG TPA: SAM-dependent DNA methyltransferase [Thiotrichaceae bacterium]|nr:SAM-dependent DNA methyltransferase [Thiotrichaceae bacterium]